MLNAVLILDNLAMGGFQRLALDQGYALAEGGYSVSLLILGNPLPSTEPSFLKSEHDLIEQFNIKIDYLGNSRWKQLFALNGIVSRLSGEDFLLSHSLRGTLLLAVQKFRVRSKAKLITTIHQLPTLSAPRQRFQRYCYAQLTEVLIGYSVAVQKDWVEKIQNYPRVFQIFFRKPMRVVRNGIYLDRLPLVDLEGDYRPRLIYLGRNTSWKGVNTFFDIASPGMLPVLNFEAVKNYRKIQKPTR
jgi:glycosyltransferase involved in cell wall biosynthesis